jgi:hypothetical protein
MINAYLRTRSILRALRMISHLGLSSTVTVSLDSAVGIATGYGLDD